MDNDKNINNFHTVEELKLVESQNLFESINWKTIHSIFYENNWQYGLYDLHIPSIKELQNIVLNLILDLEKTIFRDGLPKEEDDPYKISCGRFTISVDDIGLMQLNLDIGNVYIDD